ncbi:MAG: M4 family metallopeptidase [Stackebrandtia sp.]
MTSLRFLRSGVAAIAGLAFVVGVPATPAMAAAAAPPAAAADVRAALAADQAAASGVDKLSKGPAETFRRVSLTPGAGNLFYAAYERSYAGLRVVGGDAVVVADGVGTVRDTVASPTAAIRVDTRAEVRPAQAHGVAVKQMSTVDRVSRPELVVLAGDAPRLAYEVVASGTRNGMPSVLHVFVDARSGVVLDSWDDVRAGTGTGFHNGAVTIDTSRSGAGFAMTDTTRPGVSCANQAGTVFTGPDDVWGTGAGTNLETACVDALYGVQKEWNMLREWLGRNGIDGNGRGFQSRVGLNQANAFWNGQFASFGRSANGDRQATGMDVVAHEFGHGIFQFTPGGSGGGGNEKGGLNESTGDIFGALTEHFANNPNDPPDFLVGEEVNLGGNGPIRNMFNPAALGDPNCFSAAIPNTEVHAAAGPQNHWFYLLSQGSNANPASPTCNGSTVTGIGIQKAGQVFYQGLLRKTSAWTHAAARRATLAATLTLFPGRCTEFDSVRAAWSAINVPAQTGEPTCNSQPPGNDFSITVNPTTVSVQPGQSATATVATTITAGAAQTVTLSATGLPAGATAAFAPASIQSGASSTLTITTSANTPTGTVQVTITGDGTNTDHTVQLRLTVGSDTPPTCSDPAWSPTTSYVPGNRVTHNSHVWESTWFSTGAEPGAPTSWNVWRDLGAC